MPELPEVETVRRTLVNNLIGKRIEKINILLARLIKSPSAEQFETMIKEKTIENLARRGKYLLLNLSGGVVVVIHLRMTGRLCYVEKGEDTDKYARVIFILNNGDKLVYSDTRTLGTLHALFNAELGSIAGLAQMGPEPLSEEFTQEYIYDGIKNSKANIKALLLNQHFIGGLGNIYVDECLAAAGIHPERRANNLTDEEIGKLYLAVNDVIAAGISHSGTTFRDYRDGTGQKGSHQHHLCVYGLNNKPCKKCGTIIEKKQVAGRGTHFCPNCQK